LGKYLDYTLSVREPFFMCQPVQWQVVPELFVILELFVI